MKARKRRRPKGQITKGRVEGSWYLRVEIPRAANGRRRQRRETFFGTAEEAEDRLYALGRLAKKGGLDTAHLTFAELADRWLNSAKIRVGHRAWVRYKQIATEYLIPAFGSLLADELRPAHIEAALAEWSAATIKRNPEKPLSRRSVRHLRDTLRAMCRWGVRMELVTRDATAAVDPPKVEQKEMRTLDAPGVTSLLKAADGTELRIPITILIGTGLRRGELFGLRWTDVDLEAARLTVRRSVEMLDGRRREKPPKTARSARTIALAAFVVEAFRRQRDEQLERLRLLLDDDLEARRRQKDCVIFDRADGEPWNPDSFSSAFERLIRRSGLPKVRLHDLRHSHATLALAAGTDLKTISATLGHSAISVTANTYVHALESMQQSHAERMNAALGEAVSSAVGGSPDAFLVRLEPKMRHASKQDRKNARENERFMVAPTGIEPVFPP